MMASVVSVQCGENGHRAEQQRIKTLEAENAELRGLLALCHDAIAGLLQQAGVWTDDWNALVVELHDPAWDDLKPRLDAALADYRQEQENARVDAGQ